jgi:serine/threonine-protein kinase
MALEKVEAAERPLFRGLHKKQIAFIAGAILAIVAISNLYHHFVMTHDSSEHSATSHTVITPTAEPEAPVAQESHTSSEPVGYALTISGQDGSLMSMVPSGQVVLPSYVGSEAGKAIDVPAFYLDETEVTNYKYVEFLNQVLSRVTVENGEVRSEGKTWLILGPVYGGYEPIAYRNGRFLLQDSEAASRPVVKVTGNGALAYATFYGKRLPTETEWVYAAGRRKPTVNSPTKDQSVAAQGTEDLQAEMEALVGAFKEDSRGLTGAVSRRSEPNSERYEEQLASQRPQGSSQIAYPVFRFDANLDGIRGLRANVSEWGVRPRATQDSDPQFVVLGGLRGTTLRGAAAIPGIAQDPSMAFEDVGFRCAKSVQEALR